MKSSRKQLILSPLKKQTLTLLVLFFLSTTSFLAAQEVVRDMTFKLTGLSPNVVNDDDSKKLIKNFWKKIKFLDKYERKQSKFKGEASFGFSGDETDNNDLYKLNGGIKVSRGIYPGELEFSSTLGVVLNNKKFNEDVSNIFIAYDYHPRVGDSLFMENFAFVSRFTDAFLGVEQRYEAGAGVIFSFWSKNNLTNEGEKELNGLKVFKIDTSDFVDKQSLWAICNNKVCVPLKDEDLKKEDVQKLKNVENETRLSIQKLFSKVRVGLLIGVLVETEKVSFTDSLDTETERISREVDFDASQKLRWELRPTFDLQQNRWSLKIRPYFKFPAPWRWYEYEVNKDSKESKKFDYRIDLTTALTIKLTEDHTQNKSVALEFSYNLYFDNAPNRQFLTGLNNPAGEPLLFSAGRLHQVYRMGAKVGF